MSNGDPILEPGRPGDLLMVVEVAASQIKEYRDSPEETTTQVRAVAEATYHALAMWLGYRDVPKRDG